MKFRNYFRGSGRVLAFVFVASVLWLLFDIAALRISFNDVNQVLKEKEIVLKQGRSKNNVDNAFKHPKVNVEKGEFLKNRKGFGKKVNEIYRKWPKFSTEPQGLLNNNKHLNSMLMADKSFVEQNEVINQTKVNLTVKSPVKGTIISIPPKTEINGKVNSISAKMNKINAAVGQTETNLDVKAPLLTKALPAVQEKIYSPALKENTVEKVNHTNDTLVMSHNKVYVDSGLQNNLSKDFLKPTKTDKPTNIIDNREKHADIFNKTKPVITKKTVETAHSPSVRVRRSGELHKVMALDVTDLPRNPQAVGQFGQPASVPRDKELESRRRWSEGHFNVFLSEQIPIDRAIPDTRPQTCSENLVHDDLPDTSVIFCFVDEVWSTLLRSVHSVLNRSPPHLLKEIILVDDSSTKDYLKEQLDVYMAKFPKVKIIRLKERQGLIRARIAGASAATGEVLTFLDSHIECNVGWLEPLLERVYMDRKKVVCPVIEVISDKDMSYMLVDNFQRGIFRWPLVFGWSALPEEYIRKHQVKDSDPIR
ncbi:polypeptide N-acetylgalactosaminyltransferase [Pimephales promelas]|nr:polypeptide N-acetylgalactosaminyltransferase [Pimephales promelas]